MLKVVKTDKNRTAYGNLEFNHINRSFVFELWNLAGFCNLSGHVRVEFYYNLNSFKCIQFATFAGLTYYKDVEETSLSLNEEEIKYISSYINSIKDSFNYQIIKRHWKQFKKALLTISRHEFYKNIYTPEEYTKGFYVGGFDNFVYNSNHPLHFLFYKYNLFLRIKDLKFRKFNELKVNDILACVGESFSYKIKHIDFDCEKVILTLLNSFNNEESLYTGDKDRLVACK